MQQPAGIHDVDTVVAIVLARATRPHSRLHGERHWQCVGWTAALLARDVPTADREIAFLFALLHDSQRLNDDYDPQHGPRAAAIAQESHGHAFTLAPERLRLLVDACAGHTDGRTAADATTGLGRTPTGSTSGGSARDPTRNTCRPSPPATPSGSHAASRSRKRATAGRRSPPHSRPTTTSPVISRTGRWIPTKCRPTPSRGTKARTTGDARGSREPRSAQPAALHPLKLRVPRRAQAAYCRRMVRARSLVGLGACGLLMLAALTGCGSTKTVTSTVSVTTVPNGPIRKSNVGLSELVLTLYPICRPRQANTRVDKERAAGAHSLFAMP